MTVDIETKVNGIQCDYESLKRKFDGLCNDLDKIQIKIEYIMTNIKFLSETFRIPLREKQTCKNCEGYGKVYVSPICDMGQDNMCHDCLGKGHVWK